MRPSPRVMAARPIRATRPTTESARVAANAAFSSVCSMHGLILGADLFDFAGRRLVEFGVLWPLGDPGLDDRLERDARRLLISSVGNHDRSLRVRFQPADQR